ncbi:MAG: type II toxin-antitoxin system VapC family toxin [Corynebacterium sp.]|uniref:type II toxin-antitoxin system VapC family toxin n=1 Tax=Corynebacterium sp. TaxID=1720 RepID=UPI0026DEE725|nr:type II toxin-antitoxin system VapC family toxin [Corynebacterium sp.]MDO5668604.1 type II toxin-antitoxin system VapC family toxin [Corynebacterium sp.]
MYLLDTNVISELRKPHGSQVVRGWILRRRPDDLYLRVITVMEIELGIRRCARRDEVQGQRLRQWPQREVLDLFEGRLLAVDTETALTAASLQAPDPRPGRDCLVASTALVHNMGIVTRNIRDFKPMSRHVINPWEAD